MPEIRFFPQNLIMGEAVPFGQRYTYPTDHALDAVRADGYFNAARNRLRAGDTIRVIRLGNRAYDAPSNWVVEFSDFIVMEVSPAGVAVAEEGAARAVPKPKAKPKAKEPSREKFIAQDGAEVVESDEGYKVQLDGEDIAVLQDLAQAKDVASGAAPIPQ